MSSRIEELRSLAGKNPKTIILPEGSDPRVLEATGVIASRGIANIILIGEEIQIKRQAPKNPVTLDNVSIINPNSYPGRGEIIDAFYDLRRHKGITREDAEKTILEDPVYFAAMLVRQGVADGFVAGASHTTSNVARAALYCLDLDRDVGVMSSSFAIELEGCPYGEDGLFVLGDCGIVPNPSATRLAGIAISSSRLYRELFKSSPRVALLSYSTKGSAGGASVEKVQKALGIIKEKMPDLTVDGELQLDAAIVPEVAKIKSSGSPVAGRANVLIFPNLDAGNIAYKLIQRLARARVVGPLLEGLSRPSSDLSRGCGVEEIIDAVAATAIRA
jgi:phosphate acetyltransferase